MIPGWAKDIRMEDIRQETVRELAELVGMEAMLKFIDHYGGEANLYFPKLDKALSGVRYRHIR